MNASAPIPAESPWRRVRSCAGLILFLSLVIVILLGLAVYNASEPRAHGKPLSEWVRILGQTRHVPRPIVIRGDYALTGPAQAREDARLAIREIGRRAVPHLENFLRPPSRFRQHIESWLAKLKLVSPPVRDRQLREGVDDAFLALGPAAEPAFDTILRHSSRPSEILFAMGTVAIPRLSNALCEPDQLMQQRASQALVKFRELPEAVPVFLHFAASTNEFIAGKCVAGLMWFAQDHPDAAMHITNNPAVARFLQKNRPFTPAAWFGF